MITLKELRAAYPNKEIIFKRDRIYYPRDTVTLPDGGEICLDTNLHMTFLKEEVAGEYFNMMILNKIGESPLFKDESIRTVVIANAKTENESKFHGCLAAVASEKSITFTFLAGGN
jgi:hypothetical protein